MRRAIAAFGLYGAAGACGLLILGWVYRLWETDLRVPLYYRIGGDNDFTLLLVKSIADTGWCWTNPNLGAPGIMDLRDFPVLVDNLAFLALNVLARFTHEVGLLSNLLFLGGFLLAIWSSLFVLRHFGVSEPVALAASLLYAFMPYHFWRGTWHYFLALYYPIPLAVMVAVWLARGEPLFFRGASGGSRTGFLTPSRKGVASLLIVALLPLTGVYYAFFSGFFLATSGLIALLRRPRWARALDAGVLLAVLVASGVIGAVPFALYWRREGRNPRAFSRSADEAGMYSLRIGTMLQPTVGHRLDRLRRIEKSFGKYMIEDWDGRSLKVPESRLWFGLTQGFNEASSVALGMVGSAGFLLLLGAALAGDAAWVRRARPLADLARLNVAAVLLATSGGFGVMLARVALPQIRAYNRIGVFIAFFALFAMALAADRIGRVFGGRGRARSAYLLGVALVTVVGLLDEIPEVIPRNSRREAEVFAIDRQYVGRVEAAVPAGSRIFQLPDTIIPEGPSINGFDPYSPIKPCLHSQRLRWSCAAVEGRATARWIHEVAALPIAEMVPRLVDAGFAGLHFDRSAYPDRGAAMTAELDRLLHHAPIESDDGDWVFYPFTTTVANP
jgi:phosphoglycerol transferase